MDESKIEQMRSTLNKLEDIKNSQESIIDKINHVITDLFQHPDKELEKAMEPGVRVGIVNTKIINTEVEIAHTAADIAIG